MQKETQYQGLIISQDGIMADPDKVKVIRQMLPPTCVGRGKKFHWYVQLLQDIYSTFLSNCQISH